jgi:phosphoesterase RecJ-like protein
MRKNYRGGRTAEEIRKIISELLLREIKDPRIPALISISDVKASDDGSYATVYLSLFSSDGSDQPSPQEKKAVLAGFKSAHGLIRREIGARLRMRHTPELQFEFDEAAAYGRHIDGILDNLGLEHEKRVNSLSEIAEALGRADYIRIFPHENMDADTLGSSVALALALRALDKDVSVVLDEKIPDNIAFLENGVTTTELEYDLIPDLTILVDVDSADRIGGRKPLFEAGSKKMCLDHHASSKAVHDYNYIDTKAAAVGEIVYRLIEEMDDMDEVDGVAGQIKSDPGFAQIAEAIYASIVTDTGRFQYSNTTPETHLITAELLGYGIDTQKISVELYQNVRPEKLKLESAVVAGMRLICDGWAVIGILTNEIKERIGSLEEETEGISELLRSIRGVEVSVFLYEKGDGQVKASMRSKSGYDVAALAGKFGGGGHPAAAGFKSDKPIEQVADEIAKELADGR